VNPGEKRRSDTAEPLDKGNHEIEKARFRGVSSCAGAQLEFSDQQDRAVADVWVPFEAEVAVG
jgi:hypothetical protein